MRDTAVAGLSGKNDKKLAHLMQKFSLHQKLVHTHFNKVFFYMRDPAVAGLSVKLIRNWYH